MLVTEEEFVYDSMRNLKLLSVLSLYNKLRGEAEESGGGESPLPM